MFPADDDNLKPGKDVNVVVIPEPLGLIGRHLVYVEMPGCDHPEFCDDEILSVSRDGWNKGEWTLTGVLLNTDGTKGVDVSFGIIFIHDLGKRDEKGVSFLQKVVNRPCAQGIPVVITIIDLANASRNSVAQMAC